MSITNNINLVRKQIPTNVDLVCVSKFHADEEIMEAYQAGERIFGESKVQELMAKYERLPKDIHWHFIGHLQANKIKYMIDFVELIHGVDSIKLLSAINRRAANANRIVDCLLQVHIAEEDTKFGFSEAELIEVIDSQTLSEYKNIRICGLMGMATFTENAEQVRREFKNLKKLFDTLKESYFKDEASFKSISLGMSNDYEMAIEEGSTIVRIGSSIFGERVYN